MRSWNSRRLPISFMGGHGRSLMFGIDFQRALLGKRSERLEANPLRFGEYDLTTARTHARCRACLGQRFYKVRLRKDHRGVNLISDALPFGRLWYLEVSDVIGYAKFFSRSHHAVIRVYDAAQRDRNVRASGRFQRVITDRRRRGYRGSPRGDLERMCRAKILSK